MHAFKKKKNKRIDSPRELMLIPRFVLVCVCVCRMGKKSRRNNNKVDVGFLLRAVKSASLKKVRSLKKYFDLGKSSANGGYPLVTAAREGLLSIVRFLVEECTVDVNHQTNAGATALYSAGCGYHVEVMQYLLTHRANPELGAYTFGTPLLMACSKEGTSVMRCLVEGKANVNAVNPKGESPLFCASALNHIEAVRFLLTETDADVNLLTNNHSSALKVAIENDNEEVWCLLVQHGARIAVELSTAVTNNCIGLVRVILNRHEVFSDKPLLLKMLALALELNFTPIADIIVGPCFMNDEMLPLVIEQEYLVESSISPDTRYQIACYFADGRDTFPRYTVAAYRLFYNNGIHHRHPLSLYRAGCLLESGDGIPMDEYNAFLCYGNSRKLPQSMYRLAHCFDLGIGTRPNPVRALDFYCRAAAAGSADAMYHLATADVPVTPLQAAVYRKLAVTKGHPKAVYRMAEIRESLNELVLAAKAHCVTAQYDLGRYLIDIEQSEAEGVVWITCAARNGHPGAQCCLANYWCRTGDEGTAIFWYRRAATQGYGEAILKLCHFTLHSPEVASLQWVMRLVKLAGLDEESRRKCIDSFAASYTHHKNCTALQVADMKLQLGQFKQARALYVRENTPAAWFAVGSMYLEGQGCAPDTETGLLWYREAALRGHEQAGALLSTFSRHGEPNLEDYFYSKRRQQQFSRLLANDRGLEEVLSHYFKLKTQHRQKQTYSYFRRLYVVDSAYEEVRKRASKPVDRLMLVDAPVYCGFCGKLDDEYVFLRCGICKRLHYCSRECQRTHWNHERVSHRETCKPEVCTPEVRYMTAGKVLEYMLNHWHVNPIPGPVVAFLQRQVNTGTVAVVVVVFSSNSVACCRCRCSLRRNRSPSPCSPKFGDTMWSPSRNSHWFTERNGRTPVYSHCRSTRAWYWAPCTKLTKSSRGSRKTYSRPSLVVV